MSDAIQIKSTQEIEKMRVVGRMAAETLCRVDEILAPGITTNDINAFVHEDTLARGAIPAPLHYRGFPKSTCTSINACVCHGIPDETRLEHGDIINVDITHIFDGYHGDTSATFYIGTPSDDALRVCEVARHSLNLGIAQVHPGARIGDIGAAIAAYAESHHCSVVRDYAGHGIGQVFHEPPSIPHFGDAGRGRRLKEGMTFTIEPMINIGDWQVELQSDGWTVLTKDRSLSAQFEHTLLVTKEGCEILTLRPQTLSKSEGLTEKFRPSP